jgi:anti-sigma B factor antagonist
MSDNAVQLDRTDGIAHMTFPTGKVDGNAVRLMYETTAALMDEHDLKLLIDFTGVGLLSSGAIGMLVTIRKKMMSIGGQLHVLIPDENVMGAMRIMNLHIVMNLFEDLGSARQFKP